MQADRYIIRTMQRNELDIAIEWAAREGWNPGLHDGDCYYAADPNGFLIGLLDDEPIAAISAVKYDATFGFLGFYLVKPEFRGQGYGIQIWNAGMKYLEDTNVSLDGVVAQQENYKKSGFTLAYRNIRYEGHGGGSSLENPDIVALSHLPFEMIADYDRPFFPADRNKFVRAWISQPGSTALGVLHQGQLAGYGVIRACRNGYKIGPLVADNASLAEALFLALTGDLQASEPVYLDVPEVNPEATALAEKYHMVVSFETARMYTGEKPHMPLNRLFGVTSFEIG